MGSTPSATGELFDAALPPTRQLDRGTDVLAMLLFGWIGIFAVGASSGLGRIKLVLPTGVDETGPDVANATREILSLPDLPTGGFPVLKAAA